ncbi:MAG: preprotein translocase subunit YajC [Kofleriaceae bacterium]|jgi:preprotein translocase subunit YajC|nr:preprotein translocase subunit YajC [Kofleriaceae bacterium]MBP6840807.1 preprotein translocase subunit YajC [Kofleriaceae bacterium]
MNAAGLLMPLALLGIIYFVMIRPQVKQQRAHQAMLSKLTKGDRVITRGGLIGTISGVKDDVMVIELQEKVRVEIRRDYIEGKYEPKSAEAVSGKAASAA